MTDKPKTTGKGSGLQPPAKSKDDPRYQAMQAGLKRYNEEQKLKRQTDAQAKANLEQLVQRLALEDLTLAVANGDIKEDTLNVAKKCAATIEAIEKIAMKNRTKDMNEMWKYCMTQLQKVTGQEAAKKVEQNIDLRDDNADLSKEEMQKKLAEHAQKFGHSPTLVHKDAKS